MKRDEIARRIEIAFPGWQGEILMFALERAGLTIIPKEPDEQEIERVQRAICRRAYGKIWDEFLVDANHRSWGAEARAAAAAVREGGKP